jgi:cobalt/nickel transport system ATP-binding protein
MINVTNLTVVYPGSTEGHVLENLSFKAATGEKIALLGANGAGKSTLLLALVGILPAHDGAIAIGGVKMEKKTLSELRRKAGLVFQNPDDQLFMPTVWEDVIFGPRNYAEQTPGLTRLAHEQAVTGIDNAALAVLRELGIAHLKDRISHKLSGGEKRLAALATVLVMEPSLLLMDEPTAFLDLRGRRRLLAILKTLPQSMILATHDLPLAAEICSRAIVLDNGRIRADGPVTGILADTALLEESGL